MQSFHVEKKKSSTEKFFTPPPVISNGPPLRRDLLSNTPNCMSVLANFADIHLRGMRDKSMRSGTELAREIQLTDWSTTGEQGKLVFVVSTKPSLAQFISLFTTEKDRLSIIQVTHQFKFFTLRFLSRKNVEKKFVLTNKISARQISTTIHLHLSDCLLMARETALKRERARSCSDITGLLWEAKNSRCFGALVCPKSIFLLIINLHSAR